MFGAVLTAEAAERLGYHPYPRADRRELACRTTAGPRATTAGSAAFYGCPIDAKGDPVAPLRNALRTGRCEIRPESYRRTTCCSTAAATRRAACATSTRDGDAHEVTRDAVVVARRRVRDAAAAAALRHRQLVRPRRPLPHVPLPDVSCSARSRSGCTRHRGRVGHPPAGRPHRRRRRRRAARGASGGPAVLPRRHRRARRRRAPDHGGACTLPPGRSAHARDARLADARPHVGVHDAGRRPAAGRRTGSTSTRGVRDVCGFPAGRVTYSPHAHEVVVRATTGRRGSSRSCAKPARPEPFWVTSPRHAGLDGDARSSQPMSRHMMGTRRMGDDPRDARVRPVAALPRRREHGHAPTRRCSRRRPATGRRSRSSRSRSARSRALAGSL